MKRLSVLGSLKDAFTRLVDPERDERVAKLAASVHAELVRVRSEFRFDTIADQLSIEEKDRRTVAEAVYFRCLQRAWSDRQLTDNEARSLVAIAKRLGFTESETNRLNVDGATEVFEAVLSDSMQDCVIDETEVQTLEAITRFCGSSIGDMVERWFKVRRTEFLRTAFDRITKDGVIDDTELKAFRNSMQRLGMSEKEVQRVLETPATTFFARTLIAAMRDGRIDDHEARHLRAVASICGQTTETMIERYFAKEGEGFIRNAFVRMTEDGRIDAKEWQVFSDTVAKLGIPQPDLMRSIQVPARRFVEHVLADAKSDGDITSSEEQTINWLLEHLVKDNELANYVREEIRVTKLFADIARGKLPSLPAPRDIELRAGEIVHFFGPVSQFQTRQLSSGPRVDINVGTAVITDSRMLFSSMPKSFQIGHRKVLGHSSQGSSFEIRCEGRGAGYYEFQDNHALAVAIWKTAIGRANQTIVDERPEKEGRHIPREVRQRVWQRYGGRCAECNSDQYLEFDHVVPVAKGGSNTDNNVQLLCRRCNLGKSDRI